MSRALKYRGLEVWLENNHGVAIPLTAPPLFNRALHTISTLVHLEPKAGFTLHWRRQTGREPISALCQVFIQNGFLGVDENEFCLTSLTMDKSRRVRYPKTTSGYLNSPYKRHGLIKMGRKCDCPRADHDLSTASVFYVRLEIRRISGTVCTPRWVKGPNDLETSVIDTQDMHIIDDEKQNMLPYAVFRFEFPDLLEPKVQDVVYQLPKGIKIGTGHLKHSPRRKESTTQSHEKGLKSGRCTLSSGSGSTSIPPPTSEMMAMLFKRNPPRQQVTNPAQEVKRELLAGAGAPIMDVEDGKEDDDAEPMHLCGAESYVSAGKRKARDWDDPNQPSSYQDIKPIKKEFTISSINFAEDYKAADQLEKELTKELEEKMKMKQARIEKLRRLLGSD